MIESCQRKTVFPNLIMSSNNQLEIEQLFGELEPSAERKWLVVRTKSRREKKLADYARKTGIHYYLPLQNSVKVYQRKKIVFTKPLFPGYLFVKCSFEEKRTLTITGHTAHFLKVQNEQELLSELKQIYQGTKRGADYSKADFLEHGTKVLITAGSFEGLTGYVADQKNISEVVLQINLLRQAVAISVKPDQIKVIR